MNDLVLPDLIGTIKSVMKADTGQDFDLVYGETGTDYFILINRGTGRRYLVQCSSEYDLFGYLDYKEDYSKVDTYIYVGPFYMFIHPAAEIVRDSKQWAKRDGRMWQTAMMTLENCGGLIYDWKICEKVDGVIRE